MTSFFTFGAVLLGLEAFLYRVGVCRFGEPDGVEGCMGFTLPAGVLEVRGVEFEDCFGVPFDFLSWFLLFSTLEVAMTRLAFQLLRVVEMLI